MSHKMTRRGLIAGSIVGAAGIMGLEERILLAAMQDANDPNSKKAPPPPQTEKMPTGKLGNLTISRMILGGNLIGGWAHSRDLIYVSKLFKAYNTEEKIFQTLALAEQHGINTILLADSLLDIINKYKKTTGGKIQTIIDFRPNENSPTSGIDKVIDSGADTIYIHGASGDNLVKHNQTDVIQKTIEYIRKKGLAAGIGCHSYYVLDQCRDVKIEPDYWVKTFHHDKYWSAHPKDKREPFSVDNKQSDNHDEIHDNMFCLEPQETIDFFKTEKKPWIAFKTLAAGAIPPRNGFTYAFENGADFITVGMFDFQIAEDSGVVRDVLEKTKERQRQWYG
jgi:hypothetical protein